ncbi:MAG: single-stranded DNA-binding protein [Chlamydiales bacterium]
MNQITIAGHLGADPEVRFTASGQKVTSLRVAAKARRTTKDKTDDTIWWRVTVWGEQFDKMLSFFKKGSPIIVFGELSKPEIFTNRDGQPQVSMNITALNLQFSPFGRTDRPGSEGKDGEGGHQGGGHSAGSGESAYGQGKEEPSLVEDEIPF